MCDPMTALIIAGTATKAAGQWQSGLYASRVAKNQAKVAEQNKQLEREAAMDAIDLGQNDQRRLGREVAATVGAQTARMAANNTDLSFGSAARTVDDTRMIGREDSEALAENVRRQVKGYQVNAWNFESEKRAAKAEAKQAKVSAAFGVAETVLGGAMQYAKFRASRAASRGG